MYVFFQAEDGIRDIGVTGVQTCALPIFESTVVLAPRLRGTGQQALWPFGAQAYTEDEEVFVPISSTKSSRSVSTCSATITLQAHLKNSSRSSAPTVRFFGEAKPLHKAPYGGVAHVRYGYVL